MGWRRLIGIVALPVVVAAAIYGVHNRQGADGLALRAASSAEPQAHWTITQRSFEPWAAVVSRGSVRITGGAGPAWVMELSAPGDSRFRSYRAVVVVSAIDGGISGASVLAGD